MNEIILGLDLGTNSIGWALVEYDSVKKEGKIIDAGSRIIPMDGAEMSNFKRGLPQTKNAKRREKRGIRVGNKRYKQRRNKLIYVLQKLDMLPEQIKLSKPFDDPLRLSKINILPIDKKTKQLSAKGFLELQVKAIHEPITKKEFGQILYRFNQLRGYSGGDDNDEFQEELDDILGISTEKEYPAQESRIQTFKILQVEPTKDKKKNKPVYKIKVLDIENNEWVGDTTAKGIKEGDLVELKQIIKRSKKSGEISSIEFSVPNKTGWRKQMENLEKAFDNHSKKYGRKTYISEYFLDVLKENRWQKIRDNVILRSRYKEEFDAIWDTQFKYHFEEIDKKTIEEIVWFLFPGTSSTQESLRKEAVLKGIKHIIKEQIIYYQRPLKDQSHLIGTCKFEKDEKVVAKSHPLFQEYKLWEQINKLSITRKLQVGITKNGKPKYEYIERSISSDLKEKLFDELQEKKELKFSSVFNKVKKTEDFIEGQDFFNGLSTKSKLVGNTTRQMFKKRLGKYWDILKLSDIDNQIKLWEILFNGKGNEYDINSERNKNLSVFLQKFGVDKNSSDFEKIVIAISKIKFKRDYSSLSLKAIQKVLPLVRAGKYYNLEMFPDNINDKIIKLVNENVTDDYDISIQAYLDKNDQSILQNGGFINAFALILVYGKHTAKEISDKEVLRDFSQIKAIKRNSLRNPLVEQIVNETLMLVKDIWKKYKKPNEIKIEFARELQNSKKEREKIHEANENARKTNEQIRKRLSELKYEISKKNIEKYKLWEMQINKDPEFVEEYESKKSEIDKMKLWDEQGHIDPYTGKTIPLSDLFNKGKFDVDHIIPQSRYFDDSLANKVVCATHINKDKGNRTAMEYFEAGSSKFEILPKEVFMENVAKHFFGKKRKLLLATKIPDNPIERQKKETQYITLKVREELSKIVGTKNVKTSTGGITHYLRNHWGITEIFKKLLKERFEKYFEIKAFEEINKLNIAEVSYKDHLISLCEKLLTETLAKAYIKKINGYSEISDDEFIKLYKKLHIYKDESNKLIIKGYTKRLDHRHHSMDALIVALTNEKAVKRLNDLNKELQDWLQNNINRFDIDFNDKNENVIELFNDLDERKRNKILSEVEKFRKVEIPWKNFQNDVKETLENIIISHKPKDKLLIQDKEEKDEKGNIIKHKNKKVIRIRGALHEDTIYSLQSNKYEAYRIPLSKFSGNQFDTKGNIKKIVNPFLREFVSKHFFEDYNGKKSDAFNAEGILALNKKLTERIKIVNGVEKKVPHPPISSIKVYRKDINNKKYKISLQRMDRENSYNNKLYVSTGSNYLFAVLKKDNKRIYDIISFFDAVNLIKEEFKNCKNKDLFNKEKTFKEYFEQKNNAELIFVLKQLDMIYLPEPNEDMILDDSSPLFKKFWTNKDRKKNIFTVEKFSGKQIYFLPHTNAEVIEKKVELGSQNKLEFYKSRKIVEHCIPIRLDRLGRIITVG